MIGTDTDHAPPPALRSGSSPHPPHVHDKLMAAVAVSRHAGLSSCYRVGVASDT
jgi:hypothetical protein